jgi:hypothetical protein
MSTRLVRLWYFQYMKYSSDKEKYYVYEIIDYQSNICHIYCAFEISYKLKGLQPKNYYS